MIQNKSSHILLQKEEFHNNLNPQVMYNLFWLRYEGWEGEMETTVTA